ncbi:MAG TPA: hypothetical protein P5121_39530 [Caldilineaceae bacterium]|nr:hypothetical protein [Caldilineaceae bacterium]
MQYDILLTKQPTNGYLARPVLMPELVVSGADEQEALDRVREAITQATVQSRIVRIDVPNDTEPVDDPWLRFGGAWGDENDWEQFEKDIRAFRSEISS